MLLRKAQLNITHPRASAILTTIFLLFGIFVVSMIGIEIIMNGLAARRAQGASSKAFYAAESGAERAMSMFNLYGVIRFGGGDIFTDGSCNNNVAHKLNYVAVASPFCLSVGDASSSDLSGIASTDPQPKYWAKFTNNFSDPNNARIIRLNARGNFANTSRELFLKFCVPDCAARVCGDDGCGGRCSPDTCAGGCNEGTGQCN